jgi:hypothetical protein
MACINCNERISGTTATRSVIRSRIKKQVRRGGFRVRAFGIVHLGCAGRFTLHTIHTRGNLISYAMLLCHCGADPGRPNRTSYGTARALPSAAAAPAPYWPGDWPSNWRFAAITSDKRTASAQSAECSAVRRAAQAAAAAAGSALLLPTAHCPAKQEASKSKPQTIKTFQKQKARSQQPTANSQLPTASPPPPPCCPGCPCPQPREREPRKPKTKK